MSARYIDSVPVLHRQWHLRGYIWQAGPFTKDSQAALLIGHLASLPRDAGIAYVGRLPDSRVLLASTSMRPPVLNPFPEVRLQPWSVQLYNDAECSVPLAVLDDTGRYFQLESFGQPLEDSSPQSAAPLRQPVICEFLIALTAGLLRICPD